MRKTRKSLFLLRLVALGLIVACGVFLTNAIIFKVSAADINKSYVSSFGIKSYQDGTAPFNDDDSAGNDSNNKNGIVRTFDYVNYSLSYVTELMPGEKVVSEGNLMVEFEISTDPSVAEINTDTVNWMEGKTVTYFYDDDTSSTTWNQNKTVTKQMLSGYRKLDKNENGANAIPGAGSLSVGVYVKAAKNGDIIKPKFTVWMEGNDESLKKSVEGENVKVSAAPRYDIMTIGNSLADYLVYYDENAGTLSSTAVNDLPRGRLTGYAFGLRLYNDSADFGLKGIELPKGDITFDIKMTAELNDVDVSDDVDYRALFWDYRENNSASASTKGYLLRQMAVDNHQLQAYRPWSIPGNNNNNNRKQTCYNGGKWSIVQDENDYNTYHVTVKNYDFDRVNYIFPEDGLGNTPAVQFGANIGFFSVGYAQFIARFPSTVNDASTFLLSANARNLRATSLSGVETSEDRLESNNTTASNITLYPKGSISVRNFFTNTNNETVRATVWSAGDSSAYVGERIRIQAQERYSGDGAAKSVSLLQKFDDKAFKIPEDIENPVTFNATSSLSRVDDSIILFAAKPDKSGWIDDTEMNKAVEENLIFFKSYSELKDAGYTCVGYLVQANGEFYYSGDGPIMNMFITVDVSDTWDVVGQVFQTTSTGRAWNVEGQMRYWTDYQYDDGAYGAGNSAITAGKYVEGYNAPNYRYEPSTYGKTRYANGTVSGGHTGGVQYGNSLLIIGAKNKINISVNDKTTSMTGSQVAKSTYDLDKGEREAEFIIQPSIEIVSLNNEEEYSNQKTDLTVKAILPKGLTLIIGTPSLDPDLVESGANGTQTVTWTIHDQIVGEPVVPITFKATIGAAGTIDDVSNNDSLTPIATVSSPVDARAINIANGNRSEVTISVIKLATSSISKLASAELIETGADITYMLKYGNSDDDIVDNMRMVDVLPYDDDDRGSSFSGKYNVKQIKIDFTDAAKTFELVKNSVGVFYTTESSVRSADKGEILISESGAEWSKLSGGVIDNDNRAIVFSGIDLSNVTAVYLSIGDVQAVEYIAVDITISPVDASGALLVSNGSTQQPADIYANNFYEYADNQIGVVTSNNVFSQVVLRTLSGKLWYDKNQNGIQDDDEPVLPNVAVNLLDNSGVIAKNVLGKAFAQVKTDANGEYAFELLGPGEHRIQIAGGDYGLTAKDEGDNDAIDSDATPSVTNGRLTYANIDKIMPAASAMFAYRYDDQNNDAGFTRTTIKLNKVNNKGEILTGAEFSLGGKKYEATDGHFEIVELGSGRFSLIETLSPVGYKISGPWTIVSEVAADGSISARIDGITAETDGSYSLKDDLNDSSTKSKITKSSVTENITSKDQNVDYKITYEVEVEDYMGDAKIQIVDQLSLPIIVEESELAGGDYDPDELTITWEEDWNDINTYTGEASRTFEYEISLKYEGIEATDRNLHNDVSGTITLLDVESDVTDKSESGSNDDDADTPIKIPGRIRRRFVDKETGEEVCGSIVSSDLVGESFTSEPIVCEGWELVEGPDHDDYVFEEDEQEIIYRYRKIKNPETTAASLKAVGVNGAIVFTVATGLVWFARRRR